MQTEITELFDKMRAAAKAKKWSQQQWAAAAGVRPETISRLRRRGDCDFSTLNALAGAIGFHLAALPLPIAAQGATHALAAAQTATHMPTHYGREEEAGLMVLCAQSEPDPEQWRSAGSSYFVGGLAVMMASARGHDRKKYLQLAEALHPGISAPEVFAQWLTVSPVRPSRFLPMLQMQRSHAA